MPSSLFLLLDDIATVLDDVAVMTKVAAKKTAGVLGDDLALNAEQVSGVASKRELPVVWAVAKGSAINKLILVPAALALSYFLEVAIIPLLILGGAFLCYEGVEKLVHKFLHRKHAADADADDESRAKALVAELEVEHPTPLEKKKVRGAIRTDFILSAEIVVITLGSVGGKPFSVQIGVLIAIASLMTIGVYGLVAGIVRLDDWGMALARRGSAAAQSVGRAILWFAPLLMRFLSIAGTAAMFLVGGGILVHDVAPLHHMAESITHSMSGVLATVVGMLFNALVGIVLGTIVLAVVTGIKKMFGRSE